MLTYLKKKKIFNFSKFTMEPWIRTIMPEYTEVIITTLNGFEKELVLRTDVIISASQKLVDVVSKAINVLDMILR